MFYFFESLSAYHDFVGPINRLSQLLALANGLDHLLVFLVLFHKIFHVFLAERLLYADSLRQTKIAMFIVVVCNQICSCNS